jgi:hypothetical protein
MPNEKPSWDHILPIWWAFFWRASLLGLLAGGVFGAIGGAIMGVAGHLEAANTAGQILGYLSTLPVTLLVLRHVLAKKYASFSIQFVKKAG